MFGGGGWWGHCHPSSPKENNTSWMNTEQTLFIHFFGGEGGHICHSHLYFSSLCHNGLRYSHFGKKTTQHPACTVIYSDHCFQSRDPDFLPEETRTRKESSRTTTAHQQGAQQLTRPQFPFNTASDDRLRYVQGMWGLLFLNFCYVTKNI